MIRTKGLVICILAALVALLALSPVLGVGVKTAVAASNPAAWTTVPPAGTLQVASQRTWTDPNPVYGVSVLIQEMRVLSPPRLDVAVSYPDELKYIPYMRYAVNDGRASAQADEVLVCLSGLHAANGGFDYYAKELVSKSLKDKGKHVEVWALDRRINNMEDLTGLNEAERLGQEAAANRDPSLLVKAADTIDGYYYKGWQVNGRTFQGFYTDDSAPWLSEFGLRVCMDDIYTLITTVFPVQSDRQKKVFVAGDSLGAVMSADFACWDFDGNAATTADIGYNNVAGIAGLDALVTPNAVPISQNVLNVVSNFLPSAFKSIINTTSLSTYSAALNAMRSGSLDVLLPTSALGYVPTTYLGVEANAMAADAMPDAESTFYARIAKLQTDPRSDVILRLACSKDLRQFLSGVVWQKQIRWTNEALFGIVFDNNFNPIVMNESADGFLTGGPISEKSFPAYGNLDSILPSFIWNPLSGFMAYDKLYIPTSTTALYSWVNSDEIAGTDAAKYTSSSDEVSDLHDVAKCCYEGPTNIAEWYYTTRLFADILIANTSGAQQYGLNLLHANDLSKVPTFLRLNTEGETIGYAKMNGMNTNGITMPGQHLDVLMADADRDSVSKAITAMYHPICDWMTTTSGNVSPTPPPGPGPSSLTLTSISPTSGSSSFWSSTVSATLTGTGFVSGATVRLVKGSTTINASSVSVSSSTKITCRFSLRSQSRGAYDVIVRNPDGSEAKLAGGFTVR